MSGPRILFLDIDGVLNSAAYLAAHPDVFDRSATKWPPAQMLDPAAVERLNHVLDATGASVVVSSSWRHAHRLAAIRGFLLARGFRFGERLIDTTPEYGETPSRVTVPSAERGYEIQAWLNRARRRPVTTFAIVDDCGGMAHLTPRLVQTTWDDGLTDERADALIALLGPGAP